MLDTVLAGRTSDVLLCPVSIQYDKVIESRSYVEEMMGTPKQKESLKGLFGSSSVLGLKLGRIDVRFQEPYSIKTLIREQTERRDNFDVMANPKDRTTFLRNTGYRVLSDINGQSAVLLNSDRKFADLHRFASKAVSVAMPSALVATALLTLRSSRGVSKKELIRRVDWLISTILSRGGRVVDFGGRTTTETVDR
jgi:glycerol-3-phosphate O-acyltransferase